MRVQLLVVLCLAAGTGIAAAQTPETREEALRKEREAKAASAEPNKPNTLQRGLAFVESRGLFMAERDGLHPKLGRLTTGSGFAVGVGYRTRDAFPRHGTLDVFAAASLRKYWGLEARATFPRLAGGRILAEGVAILREYPKEAFYGVGPDSRQADQTSFMLRTARVGGRAGVKIGPRTTAGGGLEYLTPRIGRGREDDTPSMEQRFRVADVVGMDSRTNFVRSSAFLEYDYREPKNARQGGLYRIEFNHYDDVRNSRLTFTRTDVDLRQYIGFLAGRRVIALRGVLSTSDVPGGSEGMPFYLMPFLGGKDTLRGFRNYRYRGPHALLLQAEYRWEIWSALEGAIFYDTGKVAMERKELDFDGMPHAYGFGFRFNTDSAVVLRFDAAFGSRDGKRLHMTLGGVF